MSKLDEVLTGYVAASKDAMHEGMIDSDDLFEVAAAVKAARAELAALRQRAEDALKVIAAERSELWINFHTPTAQAAADELLKRIESAILKDATGS